MLAALLSTALVYAPSAPASARCAHTGSPANQLRVTPYADPRVDLDPADATVRRAGKRILVLGSARTEMLRCSGPPPTVSNTKEIVFRLRGLSFGNLDLSGGPPAPRTVFHAAGGALGYGYVWGTRAADRWRIAGNARAFGWRLDGSRSGPFDVILNGPGKKVAVAETRGGGDRVDASGVRHRRGLVLLKGGPGEDTLTGSRFRNVLDGGPGQDILLASVGMDHIFARDGFRDEIRCGGGRDTVSRDRRDVVSGCERRARS